MLSNPFDPKRAKTWSEVLAEEAPTPEERLAAHELAETARLADHLRQCGAPDRAVDALTSEPFETIASKAVDAWVATDVPFLLLLGGPGSGKTVAAVAALKSARREVHFMGASGPVRSWAYSSARGAFVDVDALKSAAYRAEGEALHERCKRVPLLCLDDLGIEVPDKAGIWQSAFDSLVKARDAKLLRTVITANCTGEQFRATYGDRAYSRIKGAGTVVVCGSVDYRQQHNQGGQQ